MDDPVYFTSDVNPSMLQQRVGAHLLDRCASLEPHIQGSSHMTYIATMANDDRFLIRVHSPVPKPNSDGTGIRMTTDYKMRSEVATLRFLKKHTKVPVPDVLVHDIDSDGQVGGQWMIMEYIDGINAISAWEQISTEQRESMFLSLADIWSDLLELDFESIGSLYEDGDTDNERPVIGPIACLPSNKYTSIATPEFDKCGPFSTTTEWLLALARRDLDYTTSNCHPDTPARIQKVVDDIQQSTHLTESISSPSSALKLEHIEFSPHNILVDRHDPTKVVAIVDWEGARVVPMWAMNPFFRSPANCDETEQAHLKAIMRERIASRVPIWKSVIGDDCKALRLLYYRACYSHCDPTTLSPDGAFLHMSWS